MKEGVFIAMPVYRGSEVIEETIRSILSQTYTDFHLVMSVDGTDDPTAEICRKYTGDPRIDVLVQETRLGWPSNLNWLIENCDREFFCYWQQDDLGSTSYLENLRRELLARPDAAIAYTDVQWFGASFDRTGTPSIEGDPLSRIMQQIEAIRYEPFRGLMRASMLPKTRDAIPVTKDESCQEEFVFLTQMAAAGAFVRIESAMYFKRLHTDNAFVRWRQFPDWQRRRGWLSMGAGMYQVARAHAPSEARPRILGQVLDRLAVMRHGRAYFSMPDQSSDEIHRFVRDFVAYAPVPTEDLQLTPPMPLDPPVHTEISKAIQYEGQSARQRSLLLHRLKESGSIAIDYREPISQSTLGFGWSLPESWGIWSDGGEATLRVPVPEGSAWRAAVTARVYSANGAGTVGYGVDGQHFQFVDADSAESLRIVVESDGATEALLRFRLPNARSPAEDRISGDSRKLGIGLTSLTIDLL